MRWLVILLHFNVWIGFFCFFFGSDPCEDYDCEGQRPYSVCQVEGTFALCVCEYDCSSLKRDPVCGSDGRTYKNECELKKFSCQKGANVTVLHKGECGRFS